MTEDVPIEQPEKYDQIPMYIGVEKIPILQHSANTKAGSHQKRKPRVSLERLPIQVLQAIVDIIQGREYHERLDPTPALNSSSKRRVARKWQN